MTALRCIRDMLFAGLVVFAILLCLGYFVGAFVAFLWVACAGVAWAGLR